MKIFIICSKQFYSRIPPIAATLQNAGHILTMPNTYDDPFAEDTYRSLGHKEHSKWKATMFARSLKVIEDTDAVLVLNFDKNESKNYIGGATFVEMYDAFRLGKKIYLYNDIPEGILNDEINGFDPLVLRGDLTHIPARS